MLKLQRRQAPGLPLGVPSTSPPACHAPLRTAPPSPLPYFNSRPPSCPRPSAPLPLLLALPQKKASMQFKALDNVLQTLNRETGVKEALSYRCADIDK